MAFSAWGALYVVYLIVGFVLVIINGILKNRKLSEAINGDLDSETKDILALIMSIALVGITISSGSWSPVEVGLCLGSVISIHKFGFKQVGLSQYHFVATK